MSAVRRAARAWPVACAFVVVACSLVQSADDILVGPGDAGVETSIPDAADAAPVDAPSGDATDAADPRWAQWRMPSGTPTNYAEDVPGVITDRVTGLQWQKVAPASAAFDAASAACAALVVGGLAGWRLPTRIELVSLLTFGRGVIPAINQTVFPGTSAAPHWSSSTLQSGGRYVVDFGSGAVSTAVGSESFQYRCVRSP